MNLTKKMLIDEIKVLQEAAKIHAQKSIEQYRKVLNILEELEREKQLLEKKVKERTRHLEKLAKYDTLTQLPNRYMFKEQLKLTLESAKLLHKPFTLIFIDLDGFKEVNDIYGHHMGDLLLQQVAKKILNNVRAGTDVVSRLGGDEFTIILPGLNEREQIKKITTKILKDLSGTFYLSPEIPVNISASLGVYLYEDEIETTVDEIIANADIAMYQAKELGKNRCTFFNEKMKTKLSKYTILKNELREAFETESFVNFVQPIVNAKTHEIVGAEVLLRWKKRDKVLAPASFIETLEEMDLIINVTLWQIETLFSLIEKMNDECFFSFNLTAKMLSNAQIVVFLNELTKRYAIDPKKIYFELTENDVARDIKKTQKVLEAISNLGFKIALDDFGTGYSSLAYIRDFDIDILKIDRAFVKSLAKSHKDYQLFRSIIEMGKILNMKIVVEGVENKKQLELVDQESFVKIQGYYFYKPMPIEEFFTQLKPHCTTPAFGITM